MTGSDEVPVPDFLRLLDHLKKYRFRAKGDTRDWVEEVLNNHVLRFAAGEDDVGGARTQLALITIKMFPRSDEIPVNVRALLDGVGVEVRW